MNISNISKSFFLSLLLFFPCFAQLKNLVEYLPIDLLNTQRFDVMAKYLYAKHRELGVKSNWAQEVSEFFKQRTLFVSTGLEEKYLDAMALEYVNHKPNTHFVIIFPSAQGQQDQVRKILNSQGSIIYEKNIHLEKNGPLNFMYLLYEHEGWLDDYFNNLSSAQIKMLFCFPEQKGTVRIFLYETPYDLKSVKKIKNEIRVLFGIGFHSTHINDTHNETVKIAQTVFVKNGLHWLNHAKLNYLQKFERFMTGYKEWLHKNNINSECFCIDGSAILSAYGLRDCDKLGFFHHGYDDQVDQLGSSYFKSHNSQLVHYTVSKDDIIFNPKYHFYYQGLKFSSLGVVKSIKLQ